MTARTCTACGYRLDPAVPAGTHPTCEPGPPLSPRRLTEVLHLLADHLGVRPVDETDYLEDH